MLLAIKEIIENLVAFGITDLLQNHLFGGLCTNAAEINRLKRFFKVITDFDVGILFLGVRQGNMLRLMNEICLLYTSRCV